MTTSTARQRVAGGDLNEAYRVELGDGRARVRQAPRRRAAGGVRDRGGGPRLAARAGRAAGARGARGRATDLLALEWVEPGARTAAGEEELGRGLARVHAAGAPTPSAGRAPLRIGPLDAAERAAPDAGPSSTPSNGCCRWPAALDGDGRRVIERVCERIDELAGPHEPPARLHGDLWSGNVHWDADGRPWLIDPAAYGGHREVDLAMLSLFGDPGPRFRAAYDEVAPLADGRDERVALYQLFPLLVHAALFGGHYGGAAVRAARRYV